MSSVTSMVVSCWSPVSTCSLERKVEAGRIGNGGRDGWMDGRTGRCHGDEDKNQMKPDGHQNMNHERDDKSEVLTWGTKQDEINGETIMIGNGCW